MEHALLDGHEAYQIRGEQPIDRVMWWHWSQITANDYNPNHVAPAELRLLYLSIKESGWTQPIVINGDNEIVDGFHRWTIAQRHEDVAPGGYVPCVVLTREITRADQQAATIRHNRARGTHKVISMAEIVREMLEHGTPVERVKEILGMEREEVNRLADRGGMKVRGGSHAEFGREWVPLPDTTPPREGI